MKAKEIPFKYAQPGSFIHLTYEQIKSSITAKGKCFLGGFGNRFSSKFKKYGVNVNTGL